MTVTNGLWKAIKAPIDLNSNGSLRGIIAMWATYTTDALNH